MREIADETESGKQKSTVDMPQGKKTGQNTWRSSFACVYLTSKCQAMVRDSSYLRQL
jgi:hypothetical protein